MRFHPLVPRPSPTTTKSIRRKPKQTTGVIFGPRACDNPAPLALPNVKSSEDLGGRGFRDLHVEDETVEPQDHKFALVTNTWPNHLRLGHLLDARAIEQRVDLDGFVGRSRDINSRHDLTHLLRDQHQIDGRSIAMIPAGVLPKLEYGDADSPSERQADAMADRVMSMPTPPSVAVAQHGGESRVDAEADAELATEETEEAGDDSLMLESHSQTRSLVRKPSVADHQRAIRRGGAAPSGFADRLHSVRGRGRPLDTRARNFLEPRFGTPLDFVRIHDDPTSAELACSIHSLAFTHGVDVFFGRDQYRPDTHAGLELLAHEITHTLQNVGSEALANVGPSVPAASGDVVSRILLPFAPLLVVPAGLAALQYMAWSELMEWLEEQVERWRSGSLDIRGRETVPTSLQFAAAYADWKDWHFEIDAHYGNLAAGALVLGYDTFSGVETVNPAQWRIIHADARDAGQDTASLQVSVDEDDIHGQVGPVGQQSGPFAFAQQIVAQQKWIYEGGFIDAFGLDGLELLDVEKITNEISGGYLHFQLENFKFLSGEFVPGEGEFKLYDQSIHFDGEGAFDNLPGQGSATIDLVRDVGSGQSTLGADASISIEHESLSGSLEVAYLNGVWAATGTAEYEDEALKGKVIFGLADRKQAFELITSAVSKYSQSTGLSQGVVDSLEGGEEPGFYAIGDLNFDFGEWMQGSTTVAIDPDGDYVAGFEWTPSAKIPIASPPLLPLGRQGATTGAIEVFSVPLHPGGSIAGGKATVEMELRAFAALGPGSIHDIYLRGLLSSSPYFLNTLALGGELDVPGRAEFRALLTGAVELHLFTAEIARGGISIEGVARLRSNAHADVNSHVNWNVEGEPTFGVEARAGLESELDLIFKGRAFAEIIGEEVWNRELLNCVYQVDLGAFFIDFAWDSQRAPSVAQSSDDSQGAGGDKRMADDHVGITDYDVAEPDIDTWDLAETVMDGDEDALPEGALEDEQERDGQGIEDGLEPEDFDSMPGGEGFADVQPTGGELVEYEGRTYEIMEFDVRDLDGLLYDILWVVQVYRIQPRLAILLRDENGMIQDARDFIDEQQYLAERDGDHDPESLTRKAQSKALAGLRNQASVVTKISESNEGVSLSVAHAEAEERQAMFGMFTEQLGLYGEQFGVLVDDEGFGGDEEEIGEYDGGDGDGGDGGDGDGGGEGSGGRGRGNGRKLPEAMEPFIAPLQAFNSGMANAIRTAANDFDDASWLETDVSVKQSQRKDLEAAIAAAGITLSNEIEVVMLMMDTAASDDAFKVVDAAGHQLVSDLMSKAALPGSDIYELWDLLEFKNGDVYVVTFAEKMRGYTLQLAEKLKPHGAEESHYEFFGHMDSNRALLLAKKLEGNFLLDIIRKFPASSVDNWLEQESIMPADVRTLASYVGSGKDANGASVEVKDDLLGLFDGKVVVKLLTLPRRVAMRSLQAAGKLKMTPVSAGELVDGLAKVVPDNFDDWIAFLITHRFDRTDAGGRLAEYLDFVNGSLSGKWEDVLEQAERFAAAGNFGTADKGVHAGGGGSPTAVESRIFEGITVSVRGEPEHEGEDAEGGANGSEPEDVQDHEQNQYGGGAPAQHQVAIEIRFAEGDRAHAGSGHTYANFALTVKNIGKKDAQGDQGFWPTLDRNPNDEIQSTARDALHYKKMPETAERFAQRDAGETELSKFIITKAEDGYTFGIDGEKSSGTTEHKGETIMYHRMTQLYSVKQRIDRRLLVAVVYLFKAHPKHSLNE